MSTAKGIPQACKHHLPAPPGLAPLFTCAILQHTSCEWDDYSQEKRVKVLEERCNEHAK